VWKVKLSCQRLLHFMLGVLFLFSSQTLAKDWSYWARHVGPAEKKRTKAIQNLKTIPNLDQILLDKIGSSQQGLALDVISALEKRDLLYPLMDKILIEPSGFLVLTLNSLMTKDNRNQVLEIYFELMAKDFLQLSPANLVAMIEPFGRLGSKLPKPILEKYSQHTFPEVQSALLSYARQMIFEHRQVAYHQVFKKLKDTADYQLQIQIKSYMEEVEGDTKVKDALSSKDFFSLTVRKPIIKTEALDLRVIFGYKDARPGRFVGDRHERLAFIQDLLQPCVESQSLVCGFERYKKDSSLFLKRLVSSKDPETQKRIILRVVHSSASTNDEANRKNPYQKVLSERAESIFLEGLKNARMVFYNGHSRFGGGPDFQPPVLNSAGYVDVSYYKTYSSGTSNMLAALASRSKLTGKPLEKLGIFSCASSKHFKEALLKTKVNKVIAGPRLLHYAEALKRTKKQLGVYLESL